MEDEHCDQRVLFDQTVSRKLVHKRQISEVFLTYADLVGPTSFVIGALWPAWHAYYEMLVNRCDSLLTTETVRQATILTAHQFFDIPLGCHFLMNGISIHMVGSYQAKPMEPVEIVLHVEVDNIQRRGGQVFGLRSTIKFFTHGSFFAVGTGDLQLVSAKCYARLRGNIATTPASQKNVPTASAAKTSLIKTIPLSVDNEGKSAKLCWELLVLSAHPLFFDHPVDHVPGMLIMESIRQAARQYTNSPNADLTLFEAQFHSFLEFEQPIHIFLNQIEEHSSTVTSLIFSVHQNCKNAISVKTLLEH
jgi:hypothetical protein